MMSATNTVRKAALRAGSVVLEHTGTTLVAIPPLRNAVVRRGEAYFRQHQQQARSDPANLPGVVDDKAAMSLALFHLAERFFQYPLSPAARHAAVANMLRSILIEKGDRTAVGRFHAEHGVNPPGFLTISPGKGCNLQCIGCYADAGPDAARLEWDIFERIVDEARTLWGTRFFVISGGEPLVYHSQGKGVLDVAEKHSDCYFLMYTNGTLIDEQMAARLAKVGNVSPAISVEGWRERTDARRGPGVFDRVLVAMARLRAAGVPFGISLTATRDNAEEILSDEFIDFFFEEQRALYGWIFHYMPIGRSFTLDLMPTPEQRLWMWRRSWEIVRERRLFLADFWNHGTACDGCIAAGRYKGGGYLYIDWDVAVTPCVFVPYSPVNIKDVYAQGKTLSDVWGEPFFEGIRQWQADYAGRKGNWLLPCINRDHHAELERLLARDEPDPIDNNAREALLDPDYARGLAEYGAACAALADSVWSEYCRRSVLEGDDEQARLTREEPVPASPGAQ